MLLDLGSNIQLLLQIGLVRQLAQHANIYSLCWSRFHTVHSIPLWFAVVFLVLGKMEKKKKKKRFQAFFIVLLLLQHRSQCRTVQDLTGLQCLLRSTRSGFWFSQNVKFLLYLCCQVSSSAHVVSIDGIESASTKIVFFVYIFSSLFGMSKE